MERLKRKTGVIAALSLLLIGMLSVAYNIQQVKASGTIYIRADGSIDPPTAPISTVDNKTYTFTGNIYDSIVVQRDNITVDGNGYKLQGTGSYSGFQLVSRNNVTIKKTYITTFGYGIYLENSTYCNVTDNTIINHYKHGIYIYYPPISYTTVSGNNITNNGKSGIEVYCGLGYLTISENNITNNGDFGLYVYWASYNTISRNNITNNGRDGVYLGLSGNNTVSGNNVKNNRELGIEIAAHWYYFPNTLRNNTMTGNKFNFGVRSESDSLSGFIQDIDASNTVDGKPVYYWVSQHNKEIPTDAGYVGLVSCTNITVKNLTLSKNYQGVLVAYTRNSTVSGNNMTNNAAYGIQLVYSNGSTLSENTILENYYGVYLTYSNNNTISGNKVTNNSYTGIELYWYCNINIISKNNVTNSGSDGISLCYCSNCTISGNSIKNNDYYGISISYIGNHIISGNILINNSGGIFAYCGTNRIINNIVTNNTGYLYGIFVSACDNIIINNTVTNNPYIGIRAGWNWASNYNRIINNTVTNNRYGIDAYGYNNTFINNTLTNNSYFGICLAVSNNSIVERNNVLNSVDGIHIHYSSRITFKENKMTSNTYNFRVSGDTLSDFIQDIDASNTVDGKPVYYWVNQHDKRVPADAGFVGLVNCTNITLEDLTLRNNYHGVLLAYANSSLIESVSVSDNYYGVHLIYSYNNTLINSTLTYNNHGIWVSYSHNNTIYHNDFIGNTVQVHSDNSVNIWDDGYPSGGNYWSDYTGVDFYSGPYQNITGSDGIGDTPRAIDANNRDRYPLMEPLFGIHDIAVTNVTSSKTVLGQGYYTNITVTVENQGTFTETFNVTVYANTTVIETKTNITLASGNSTTVTFNWNTTGFAKGNYTISAYAWPVPGETDTTDNNFADGWVIVAMVGDVNADGKVDLKDVYAVAKAYGSYPGHPKWNPVCDINDDQKVDLKDYYTVCKNYGKTDP